MCDSVAISGISVKDSIAGKQSKANHAITFPRGHMGSVECLLVTSTTFFFMPYTKDIPQGTNKIITEGLTEVQTSLGGEEGTDFGQIIRRGKHHIL